MDYSKYQYLIEKSSLYGNVVIKRFGTDSPHWKDSNWHQKELSLRHDMCCILLCNLMELETGTVVEPAHPLEVAERNIIGEDEFDVEEVDDYEDEDPDTTLDMAEDVLQAEAESKATAESERKKRFVILEGITWASIR